MMTVAIKVAQAVGFDHPLRPFFPGPTAGAAHGQQQQSQYKFFHDEIQLETFDKRNKKYAYPQKHPQFNETGIFESAFLQKSLSRQLSSGSEKAYLCGMEHKACFDRIRQELSVVYPPEEARAIAFVLFEEYLHLSRSDLFLDPAARIDPSPALEQALRELLSHRPLQYVLGHAEFCGLTFQVDERVLIPRSETEELVRWIADEWAGRSPRILDIGTGSGAIAIALANIFPQAVVCAVDISEAALRVAESNAKSAGVGVVFQRCDILRELPAGRFDVIVSNPPYVRRSEKALMRRNVLDYEPEIALFVPDDDPLRFYRRIAALGREMLNAGGMLYLEINEAFGDETAALLTDTGYSDVALRRDFFGRERMLKGNFSGMF
jgi:release factor glutamine methyltransferase